MVWVGVLAGGWGKRLGPLTERRPKPLIRLAGKRIIDYTLDQVTPLKPSSGVIIVHPAVSQLENVPEPFKVVSQRKPGLSSALKTAFEYAEDDLIVISFTGYLSKPNNIASSLLEYYSMSRYHVVMALAPVSSGLETFGFARMGMGNRIEEVTEKLEEWRAGRGYVFAGVLAGKRKLLQTLAEKGFINGINIIARNNEVGGYVWEGDWLEIAYPWDFLEAPRLLLSPDETIIREGSVIAPSARIGRGVIIEKGVVIGENAVIEGPSYIGRGVEIGANAVIGPGSIIEENAVVKPLAVIKNTIVFESAEIGEGAVLEGCIIGEHARVAPHVISRRRELAEPPPWAIDLLEGNKPRKLSMGSLIKPHSLLSKPCQELVPGGIF